MLMIKHRVSNLSTAKLRSSKDNLGAGYPWVPEDEVEAGPMTNT